MTGAAGTGQSEGLVVFSVWERERRYDINIHNTVQISGWSWTVLVRRVREQGGGWGGNIRLDITLSVYPLPAPSPVQSASHQTISTGHKAPGNMFYL